MSRYASSCKWCGDRPGGCLYCVEQLENLPEDKLRALHQMIEDGEIHVVAVRTNQEILVRQVNRSNRRQAAPALQRVCTHHEWRYDRASGIRFTHRYCTHPGCKVTQRFVWLPESADVCGKWVDETAITVVQKTPQRKAVRKIKTKQTA
jgi:hypothetical protein